jgi:phosphoribosylamine---glycine ligase
MKVLFISQELIGSGLCLRLLRDGHDIKLYIRDKARIECLTGIVPKTDDWKNELSWVGKDGLIIFDDVGFGKVQDNLRKKGFQVIGGSEGGDRLELDRDFFQETAIKHGITTPSSYYFNTCKEAIDFIHNNPRTWVLKQHSHISILNYVGESNDGADVLGLLYSYEKAGITGLQLQERVHGIEVGVARYFNGTDWVGPIEINHEHKRLSNGDIGPLTAEMGTVIWHSEDDNLPLFKKVLDPLKDHLTSINFRGDIDINCIVHKKTAWALEATPRFGTPSTQLQSELYTSDMGDFMYAVASGDKHLPKYKKDFGVVVSVAVPPFPNPPTSTKAVRNVICDFTQLSPKSWNHIYLEEISKREVPNHNDVYYWAGKFGYALYVTGSDKDISVANNKALRIISNIIIPNKIHRTDIGERVQKHDLQQLKKWGWI